MPWPADQPFPYSPDDADRDGLVAVGGALEPSLLLAAYRVGIFPWSSKPMVTWWSPDPRAVFELEQFHPHRSVLRSARRGAWTYSIDRAFTAVMRGCAEPQGEAREATWISEDFVRAYVALHRLGHAHSVEVWAGEELIGGLYGVTIGGFFGGESMFHRRPDASKAAMTYLVERLRAADYWLLDAQVMNPHLAFLGAVNIPRGAYLVRLKAALAHRPRRLSEGE